MNCFTKAFSSTYAKTLNYEDIYLDEQESRGDIAKMRLYSSMMAPATLKHGIPVTSRTGNPVTFSSFSKKFTTRARTGQVVHSNTMKRSRFNGQNISGERTRCHLQDMACRVLRSLHLVWCGYSWIRVELASCIEILCASGTPILMYMLSWINRGNLVISVIFTDTRRNNVIRFSFIILEVFLGDLNPLECDTQLFLALFMLLRTLLRYAMKF